MGLFSVIKELFRFRKELKKSIEDSKKREQRYLQMNFDELGALSDDELFEAAVVRTEHKVDSFDEWEDGVNSLNPSQKILYSVNWLEVEVNNGGLCQFFVNSSRMVAPFVSEYMGVIGAEEHKKLFDDFIAKNNIDLADLSSFDIDEAEEFEAQNQRYPFDEYDEAFYETEPLETYLKRFVRENLNDF